jgi:hypothetical protein
MSAKRPFTKQYLESLEKHNEALDQYVSLLESKLAQCLKEHGGFREPQLQSRPVMSPIIANDFEMDMVEEESPTESGTDSDGDTDIKQLIAPKKRFVVSKFVMKHQVVNHTYISAADYIVSGRRPLSLRLVFTVRP